MVGLISALVALILWEVVARSHIIVEGNALPTASSSLDALVGLVGSQSFWLSVLDTVQAAVGGFLLALLIAVPTGIVIGLSETVSRSTRIVVEFLKPIPPVVLIPVLLLVLGPSERMALVLVTFGCVWPILVQTAYGVHDADPVAVDTARSFGLGPTQRLRRIVLPSALPFIVSGTRIAAGAAFVIAIVAELIGGAPGLGKDILLAQNAGLFPQTYALVLATGFLGLVLYALINALERIALHWHPSVRSEGGT